MKIAVIVTSKKKAGPVIVAADQIKLLVERGHECALFYFDETNGDCIDFVCPTQKISFKSKLDFSQYDIIHCHGARPNLFVTLKKPFFSKTKFVASIHCYVYRDFCLRYGKLRGFLLGCLFLFSLLRFDKKIVLNKDAVKYYKRFFFFSNVYLLYNTIDISSKKLSKRDDEEIKSFKGDSFLFGMNGRVDLNKGSHLIISKLSKLPECKLFILGDGVNLPEMKQFAKKCGVAERVYFAGFRKNAVDYLPYYDVFLMLSKFEMCPLALLEAMSLNKKIVCSDIPVHKEMLYDTEAEFFDIKHPETLIPAIKRALAYEGDNSRMHRRFQECFSKGVVVKKLLTIYESLIDK